MSPPHDTSKPVEEVDHSPAPSDDAGAGGGSDHAKRVRRAARAPAPAPVPPPPAPTPPERQANPTLNVRPLEWTGQEPPLQVPEWSGAGLGEIGMDTLSRHILAVGGTGSGKTVSCVLPVLRAALRYPGAGPAELRPAIVVLDPKRELAAQVERTVREERLDRHLVRLGDGGGQIDLFEAEDRLALHPQMVVERVFALSDAWQREQSDRRSPFFIQAAQRTLEEICALDFALYAAGGAARVRAFWDAVGDRVAPLAGGPLLRYDPARHWDCHLRLIVLAAHRREVVGVIREACGVYGVPPEIAIPIATWDSLPHDTWSCVVSTLSNAAREVRQLVGGPVWLCPIEPPPPESQLRVLEALGRGWCLSYEPPEGSAVDALTLRLIKDLVFRLALLRPDKTRPVIFVADEFHRVVSGDASSEADLLDRCRAYRICAVLATQSVAALRRALGGSAARAGDSTLDAILGNCSTRMIFRSADPETQTLLERLLPEPPVPGRMHVARVRPVASLGVGEAYLLRADGGWCRTRVRLSPG
jgi:hypothetical protein